MTQEESQNPPVKPVTRLLLVSEMAVMADDLSNYALEDVITFLRKLIWRYYEYIDEKLEDDKSWGAGMEILGRAAARLGRLVEIRKKLCDGAGQKTTLHQEVLDILAEIDHLIIEKEAGC
jgi:hypothetical protein